MRGFRQIIVEGNGFAGVLPSLIVLALVAVTAATAGALLLRPDRGRESWA